MERSLKIVIINKSDSTGGAAIVSRRLMEALRAEGADARMLVVEKKTDSPFVEVAGSKILIKKSFVWERLKIYFTNGFNRSSLFKIDTGEDGLHLWKHPLVENADAIILNWINQGMLSLTGVRKILKLGKPVIWTMHDMWNMTGVCHHAGNCQHYKKECGDCPLLGKKKASFDLSYKVWKRKKDIYSTWGKNAFVSVSSWLADKAKESSLLGDKKIETIPNPFNLENNVKEFPKRLHSNKNKKIRILFGAARLDDPIKGLDVLKEMTKILAEEYPSFSENLELALFGNVKDLNSLKGFYLPTLTLGVLNGENDLRKAYADSEILVSASSYETLPGTLVEAQAYGCIPVSFNRGGQKDIITQKETGYLAERPDNIEKAAKNLAEGIVWASEMINNQDEYERMVIRMAENVKLRFSYSSVANKYLSLIRKLKND